MMFETIKYVYQKQIIIHFACMFHAPNDFYWDARIF